MITDKEKQQNSITRMNVAILAAYWNIPIRSVFKFYEQCGIKYSWKATRTAYYRARWEKHKKPVIKKELEKKLYATLKEITEKYPKTKKVPLNPSLDIQGEYSKSINALIDRATGKNTQE